MKLLFNTLLISLFIAGSANAQVVVSQSTDNGWYVNPIANDSNIHSMPIVQEAKKTEMLPIATIDDRERRCIKAQNLAKKDNYNKELKYYQFGMPAGDFPHGIKRELLKEKYNLDFIMMGCVPVDSLMCYNREAEKILFRKYGKDFWLKVNEEVDHAANNTGFGPRDGYGRGEEVKPSDSDILSY